MHANQLKKAEELISALGILGRAQEDGVDDDVLTHLTSLVKTAAREFVSTDSPAQQTG